MMKQEHLDKMAKAGISPVQWAAILALAAKDLPLALQLLKDIVGAISGG